MTAPRARRRQGGDSRVGTMLAVVGCLGALGAAFGVGLYAGWSWARSSPAGTSAVTTEKAPARVARPATPAFTFYQELTAPLGSSPLPRKSPAAERRTDRTPPRAEPAPARPAEARDLRSEPGVAAYTVQVGAYRDRASAESLRAAIAAAGHDAYVVEMDGAWGGARYRVRVGSFTTREAAAAVAARLERDGQRSAYVTAR